MRSIRKMLTHTTHFISDIYERNMLYCYTVRAQQPSAAIVSITPPELPEHCRFLTARDIPGRNRVMVLGELVPVLADLETHYAGEPIGLLVGPVLRELMELATRVEVRYEPLPAVQEFHPDEAEHLQTDFVKTVGAPEQAMRAAFQVVEGEYQTEAQEHLYSEPQAAFVQAEAPDRIAVYSASQWPFHVREAVSTVLKIPQKRCVVRATDAGVALDGKLWYPSLVAAHAAIAHRATGRPIKLVYTREEDFLNSTKRAPSHIKHVTGLDRDGNLMAMQVTITLNTGAYPLLSDEMLKRMMVAACGLYNCRNVRIRARAVRTNLTPMNAFAGFGTAQAFFAVEAHAARISEVAQVPPQIWKEFNLLRKGQTTITGGPAKNDLFACGAWDWILSQSDFARKHAAFELQKKRRIIQEDLRASARGIGVAVVSQGSGFLGRGEEILGAAVAVRLEESDRAVIRSSAIPEDRGIQQIWMQTVARILTVDEAKIEIAPVDTDTVPDSGPSTLSRNLTVITHLIESCCNAIKRRRFRSPLPIEVRRVSKLSRKAAWHTERLEGSPFSGESRAVAVVEVEGDAATFETNIRGIWLAVDAGRILNPEQARKTLEMGVFQGLGWAASETLSYLTSGENWIDYKSYHPGRLMRHPKIEIEFFGDNSRAAPQGITEIAISAIPAAYVNAITQATGRYLDRIPATPELVYEYLEDDE